MDRNNYKLPVSTNQMPTQEQLDKILCFDTCTISNAIECFDVRLRNEGFTRPGLNCVTGVDERIIGYAATFRVRTGDPPVLGEKFTDHNDWWTEIELMPRPRIAVIENVNGKETGGSCAGEVHVAILKAFGCVGVITDGMVRDLSGLKKLRLPVFAKSLTVSHSYLHFVKFGTAVEIMGLEVQPGDLLYADSHGVLNIPIGIVAELPHVAERILREDQAIIKVCQSPGFSQKDLLIALSKNNQCS